MDYDQFPRSALIQPLHGHGESLAEADHLDIECLHWLNEYSRRCPPRMTTIDLASAGIVETIAAGSLKRQIEGVSRDIYRNAHDVYRRKLDSDASVDAFNPWFILSAQPTPFQRLSL
jgi:hypothetical protein